MSGKLNPADLARLDVLAEARRDIVSPIHGLEAALRSLAGAVIDRGERPDGSWGEGGQRLMADAEALRPMIEALDARVWAALAEVGLDQPRIRPDEPEIGLILRESDDTLTLRTYAVDGGVALRLADGHGALELRMGNRAATWLCGNISRAALLDPPWRPPNRAWVDQMLEVGDQFVEVSEGLGYEPQGGVFVRVVEAMPQLDNVLDAPAAVFADDFKPDGRSDCVPRDTVFPDFDERSLGGVGPELLSQADGGGQDGLECGDAQGLIGASAIVGQCDPEAGPAGEACVAEGDNGEPLIAGAAGVLPVNLEVLPAQPGQVDDRHPDLSCVSQPGVDAESPEGSCAPSAAEHAPGPRPAAGGAS